MKKGASRNIRLGLMVIIGATILVAGLYFIGDKQNLFGSTIQLKAHFTNVNGLNVGNNVRYVGIDVGTVTDINIMNDSIVLVEMTIESEATEFIRTNAVASIGTDGLMGNKLVNIQSVRGVAPYIKEGDVLKSVPPINTDEVMRTLNETNKDMYLIAENLKSITNKIEEENMIWNLLGDSLISSNIKSAIANIELTSSDLTHLTKSFREITGDVKSGEGLMGTLIYDTLLMNKMDRTMANLQIVSDSLSSITNDFSRISVRVKEGKGAAGTILMDDEFDEDLTQTIVNMKKASATLDENLEALKHNFLFRRYFKKKAKEENK